MKAATNPSYLFSTVILISIHAAREGGDKANQHRINKIEISIHAAREGGDSPFLWRSFTATTFQSTPPVKAATAVELERMHGAQISIHAAREGGDTTPSGVTTLESYFNPRRP